MLLIGCPRLTQGYSISILPLIGHSRFRVSRYREAMAEDISHSLQQGLKGLKKAAVKITHMTDISIVIDM